MKETTAKHMVAALETKRGDVLDAGLGMTNKKGGCNNDFVVLTVQAHPQLMPSPSTTNSYLTNLHHHHQLTLNKVPDKYPRTCTKSVQKVVCFFCAIALLVVISLIILVEMKRRNSTELAY